MDAEADFEIDTNLFGRSLPFDMIRKTTSPPLPSNRNQPNEHRGKFQADFQRMSNAAALPKSNGPLVNAPANPPRNSTSTTQPKPIIVEDSKISPKCARCRNHGEVTSIKGHKNNCPWRLCRCKKCLAVLNRQRVMAKQIKTRRRAAKLKAKFLLNPVFSVKLNEKAMATALHPAETTTDQRPTIPLSSQLLTNGSKRPSLPLKYTFIDTQNKRSTVDDLSPKYSTPVMASTPSSSMETTPNSNTFLSPKTQTYFTPVATLPSTNKVTPLKNVENLAPSSSLNNNQYQKANNVPSNKMPHLSPPKYISPEDLQKALPSTAHFVLKQNHFDQYPPQHKDRVIPSPTFNNNTHASTYFPAKDNLYSTHQTQRQNINAHYRAPYHRRNDESSNHQQQTTSLLSSHNHQTTVPYDSNYDRLMVCLRFIFCHFSENLISNVLSDVQYDITTALECLLKYEGIRQHNVQLRHAITSTQPLSHYQQLNHQYRPANVQQQTVNNQHPPPLLRQPPYPLRHNTSSPPPSLTPYQNFQRQSQTPCTYTQPAVNAISQPSQTTYLNEEHYSETSSDYTCSSYEPPSNALDPGHGPSRYTNTLPGAGQELNSLEPSQVGHSYY